MSRDTPTVVEIDLGAIRHNYQVARERIDAGVKVITVVKSDAYGHGAVPISRVLQGLGADMFAVGTVDEGIQLREAGIKRPILLLLGLVQGRGAELIRYQLTPVIYDLDVARDLHNYLKGRGDQLEVHLKVDTGMTRLGVSVEECHRFFDEICGMGTLRPVGLVTHLADADDSSFSAKQIHSFEKARVELLKRVPSVMCHVANSIASLDRRFVNYGMARLGLILYGAYPVSRQKKFVQLKPAMRWVSRLVSVKKVPKGTAVGYGRTYLTKKPSRIGCVPVGYADGYPRLVSNRASVLVRGIRVPVIGTVCMDMLMVDLTRIPQAKPGDEVVLLGPQGKETITAEELGKWANTISYEIFCQVASRLPRTFLQANRH